MNDTKCYKSTDDQFDYYVSNRSLSTCRIDGYLSPSTGLTFSPEVSIYGPLARSGPLTKVSTDGPHKFCIGSREKDKDNKNKERRSSSGAIFLPPVPPTISPLAPSAPLSTCKSVLVSLFFQTFQTVLYNLSLKVFQKA